MKALKELHDAAKKINPGPQYRLDVLCSVYNQIRYILDDQYIDNREQMLGTLNFHLKHLAFLVTQDESKFAILSEIQFRIARAARLYKGIVTEHDLSSLSDNEYEEYLKLIVKTSLEDICK